VLSIIPADDVWSWIEGDLEKRPWYVASLVPPTLPGDVGHCSARELLLRYGGREDVRRNLRANFSSETWSGPASQHYDEKRRWLASVRVNESDGNVLRWIDEYAELLEHQVAQARIEEERDGF
jgi:hypothetical protein